MWDVMSSLLSWAGSLAYPWSWGWVQLLLETKWMRVGEGRFFKEKKSGCYFQQKGGKRLGRQKQQMSTLTAFQLTIHGSPGANSIQRAETVADSMSLAVSIFFVRLVPGLCLALYKESGYAPCPTVQTMASPMLIWEKLWAPLTGVDPCSRHWLGTL